MPRNRSVITKLFLLMLLQLAQCVDPDGEHLSKENLISTSMFHNDRREILLDTYKDIGLAAYTDLIASRLQESTLHSTKLILPETNPDSKVKGRSRRNQPTGEDYDDTGGADAITTMENTTSVRNTAYTASDTATVSTMVDSAIAATSNTGETYSTEAVKKCPENVELKRLSQVNISASGIASMLTEIIEAMNNSGNSGCTTQTDIRYISDIISHFFNLADLESLNGILPEIIPKITAIISNIMEAPEKSIAGSGEASKIITSLERLLNATAYTLEPNKTLSVAWKNLAIQVTSETDVIGFQLLVGSELNGTTTRPIRAGDNRSNDNIGPKISLSPDVQVPRKSFVVYINDKLFQGSLMQPASHVILSAHLSKSLTYPDLVNMQFQTKWSPSQRNISTNLECGFWDFAENEWSTYGCISKGVNENGVLCSCNHTTNYAILMRISSAPTNDTVHHVILQSITRIGLSLSVALLTIVIVSFLLFRKLRKTVSQQVLFNLSLSILLLDSFFLVGIDQTENEIACITLAILLHVFLLASVAWMSTEAVLQYLRFVKVLGTYIPRFTLKALLAAWGVPILVVGCVALSDYNLYNTKDKGVCWVRKEVLYYGVLLPVALSMSFNAVVFALIMRSLMFAKNSLRSNKTESETMRLHLRAAVAIFVVTGLTWTFGFFSIEGTADIVFQYLFSIFNTVQGALIAILHSLREKALQSEWRKLLCKEKKKPISKSDSGGFQKTVLSKVNSRDHEQQLVDVELRP